MCPYQSELHFKLVIVGMKAWLVICCVQYFFASFLKRRFAFGTHQPCERVCVMCMLLSLSKFDIAFCAAFSFTVYTKQMNLPLVSLRCKRPKKEHCQKWAGPIERKSTNVARGECACMSCESKEEMQKLSSNLSTVDLCTEKSDTTNRHIEKCYCKK